MANQPRPASSLSWLRWVVLPTLLFGGAYLFSYFENPLALAPQLDAKENLAIAGKIALGELPAEPMYRAMLYPWVLARFLKVGVPADWIPVVASLLGLLCHLGATVLVALLARRLWKSERAGLLSGILYGINPVAVYFAAIPFDITLGILLFLGGLWSLVALRTPWKAAACGGTFFALAVLARPHFLPVALMAPLILIGLRGEWRGVAPAACLSWAPLVLALLVFGGINRSLSGEFRVMPWQGAFNLYSANKPGADGRFHVQSVFLTDIEAHENPTRLESEILYGRETGSEPPFSIDSMNAHWRGKTVEGIRENFSGWIGLKLRKTYYLLNNWEHYNNLTYAYHRKENALLRFNPIGWGLLLVAAAGGLFLAFARKERWSWGLCLTLATYAGGVGLFFVSARFRLPLAPLLCVLSAGLVYAVPSILRSGNPRKIAGFCAVAGIAAAISFSRFLDVADTSTFIQDESLLANAAAELGRDATACAYAARVLARDPERRDADRIMLISYLNLRLADNPAWQEFGDWVAHRKRLENVSHSDPTMQFVAGGFYWQFNEREKATDLWREAASAGSGAARAMLVLTGADSSVSPDAVHPAMREQLERILE